LIQPKWHLAYDQKVVKKCQYYYREEICTFLPLLRVFG
jgi:hypothetical protein